ncbi:MAG: FecR family protein [Chitinophagaceae bacterium]
MEKGNEPDNIKKAYRTAYLIAGFLKESLTEPEKQELNAWVNENEHNKKLFAELTNQEKLQEKLKEYNQAGTEQYLEESKQELSFNNRRKVRRLWAYGVAASFIAFVIIIWVAKPFTEKQGPIVREETDTLIHQSGQLEKEKVVLDMGKGKKIVLGETKTDSVIDKGLLIKEGKELVYQTEYSENEFHTLTVPHKSFYHLRLPDGTKVYLNASSSIRFPTHFPEKERRVYISGEAYFEVAHNSAQPFRVEAAIKDRVPMVVEAVGTAFNVNTYTDEPFPSATLVEGKINVSLSDKEMVRLVPNQQARVTSKGLKVGEGKVDVITAWTKNEFNFDDTPLSEVLRQLARWYNVEIIQNVPDQSFKAGPFSRNQPLEYWLKILSKTEEFTYRIDGRRVTITK